MNQAMPKKQLAQVFDRVTREVTERTAGILLREGGGSPAGELCTVYASFQRGYQSGLSLCAERSLFTRLTRGMMQDEEVSAQDVEDFTKEYFNVLCGLIISEMYRETKIAARFGQPVFYQGRYAPREHQEQFSICYTSDGAGGAELVHHVRDMAADELPG